jgi:hypothetical protein
VDNFFFIESQEDLGLLSDNLREEDVFLYAIPCSTVSHPCVDEACLIFVHGMTSKKDFVIALNHSEAISSLTTQEVSDTINAITKQRYVVDKKSFCQLCSICDTIDVNVLAYATTFEYLDFESVSTTAHHFYRLMFGKCKVLNQIIPIAKHFERFQQISEAALTLLEEKAYDIQFDSFLKLNNEIVGTLCDIERSGLYVDHDKFVEAFGAEHEKCIHDNKVYTQYNIFTSTGRPSNRYGGISYAALNKQDDTRSCFISRFGDDGKLIDMDFKAFHPRLIANLINYKLSPDVDIYAYLATYYFNKKKVTKADVKQSKLTTFRQFYGGIEQKYLSIPFFKKTQALIDQKWAFFKKNGYIETPIYNRLITTRNLGGAANANKVFNFLLQAYETEVGLHAANQILDYLKDKQTRLTLYTYDSMLLDFHKDDGKDTLLDIRKIMLNNGKFPISTKAGNNYKDMAEITL